MLRYFDLLKFLFWLGYVVGYLEYNTRKKDLEYSLSPCHYFGSGGWIRTNDLRVMSPTSYQTAPPRIKEIKK